MSEAITERAAMQFLVWIDTFSVKLEGDYLFFWIPSFSNLFDKSLEEVITKF